MFFFLVSMLFYLSVFFSLDFYNCFVGSRGTLIFVPLVKLEGKNKVFSRTQGKFFDSCYHMNNSVSFTGRIIYHYTWITDHIHIFLLYYFIIYILPLYTSIIDHFSLSFFHLQDGFFRSWPPTRWSWPCRASCSGTTAGSLALRPTRFCQVVRPVGAFVTT